MQAKVPRKRAPRNPFSEEYFSDGSYLKMKKSALDYFGRNAPWRRPESIHESERIVRSIGASSHGVKYSAIHGVELSPRAHFFVKPVTPEKAQQEFDLLHQAHRMRVRAVEPIGFMVNPNTNKGWLFTRAKTHAMPWSHADFAGMQESERKSILRDVGKTFKSWHGKGFFHRDPKLKNLLRVHGSRSIIAVDLEKAKFQRKTESVDDRGYDLALFVGDAMHRGLIHGTADARHFLRHYTGSKEMAEEWLERLRELPQRHRNDKVIANLSSL